MDRPDGRDHGVRVLGDLDAGALAAEHERAQWLAGMIPCSVDGATWEQLTWPGMVADWLMLVSLS